MLNVIREKEIVKLVTTVYVPGMGSLSYDFAFGCIGGADHAALLRYRINEAMGEKLRAIREGAYQRGWREAKAHKGGKQAWHSSDWDWSST